MERDEERCNINIGKEIIMYWTLDGRARSGGQQQSHIQLRGASVCS